MRLAAPIAEQKMAADCGHHSYFSLSDVDEVTTAIVRKEVMPSPGHQPGFLPAWLTEQGACVVIASGMGSRARTLLAKGGTQTVVGALGDNPEKVLLDYVRGKQATGDNVCGH